MKEDVSNNPFEHSCYFWIAAILFCSIIHSCKMEWEVSRQIPSSWTPSSTTRILLIDDAGWDLSEAWNVRIIAQARDCHIRAPSKMRLFTTWSFFDSLLKDLQWATWSAAALSSGIWATSRLMRTNFPEQRWFYVNKSDLVQKLL